MGEKHRQRVVGVREGVRCTRSGKAVAVPGAMLQALSATKGNHSTPRSRLAGPRAATLTKLDVRRVATGVRLAVGAVAESQVADEQWGSDEACTGVGAKRSE